jgi:hypothetical protein
MVKAEIMAPFVKHGDPFWNFIARNSNHGAVRRMRTRIRLQAQPEPMRSIVGATQQEQRFD